MWTTISAIAVSHIVSNDNIKTDQRCVQISQKTDMILLPEITKCLFAFIYFDAFYFVAFYFYCQKDTKSKKILGVF